MTTTMKDKVEKEIKEYEDNYIKYSKLASDEISKIKKAREYLNNEITYKNIKDNDLTEIRDKRSKLQERENKLKDYMNDLLSVKINSINSKDIYNVCNNLIFYYDMDKIDKLLDILIQDKEVQDCKKYIKLGALFDLGIIEGRRQEQSKNNKKGDKNE